jgi:protein-S-isoprenylcysteine O-methyltransferase Ste14
VLPLISGLVCFASFGWGMFRHFRRVGKPAPLMLVTGLLAFASAAIHITALARRYSLFPRAAVFFYLAGAALFWSAVRATRGKGLAACYQGQVTPELVTTGPYRFIRHPFYTSYILVWVAGYVATGRWPLIFSACVMVFVYDRSARQEEKGFDRSPLAARYRSYKERTGRYLPALPAMFRTRPI